MYNINICPKCHQPETASYFKEGYARCDQKNNFYFIDRPLHILFCKNCSYTISSYDGRDTVIYKWNNGVGAD